jgi:hypothetical protein
MADLRAWFVVLALACAPTSSDPPVAPPEAPPAAGWADRLELIRADLGQIEAAHAAKDKDAAVASWEQAYLGRFEPLIEQSAGQQVDVHAILAVEYAFGRLRDRLESPREAPVQAAVASVRASLDALEPIVVALPAPAP